MEVYFKYVSFGCFYVIVWVSFSDLSNFVVGCAWQLICQVSLWLLYYKLISKTIGCLDKFLSRKVFGNFFS